MLENELVKLKLIGFNKQESENFRAILTLAGRALRKKWQISEGTEADFFLLSVNASKANSAEIIKSRHATRYLFCITDAVTDIKQSLLVDDRHIPSLKALVSLFNQLSTNSAQAISKPEPPLPAEKTTVATPFFDPQLSLLKYLLSSEPKCWMMSVSDQPDSVLLYIDIEKSVYYSHHSLAQLSPSLIQSFETWVIKPCSNIEIKNFVTSENLKPCVLRDLIWLLVMQLSAGRILKNHANTEVVALKIWPDLRLFKCLDYAKAAAFMKNNAASLEIIAAETQVPLEALYDFYNACYLTGLIEKRTQLALNPKKVSAEQSQLLTQIEARLKS